MISNNYLVVFHDTNLGLYSWFECLIDQLVDDSIQILVVDTKNLLKKVSLNLVLYDKRVVDNMVSVLWLLVIDLMVEYIDLRKLNFLLVATVHRLCSHYQVFVKVLLLVLLGTWTLLVLCNFCQYQLVLLEKLDQDFLKMV